jgi:hypothetical protein
MIYPAGWMLHGLSPHAYLVGLLEPHLYGLESGCFALAG